MNSNSDYIQKEAHNVPDNPKKIAIVGLTGAGKTSLLKTLFRQFDEIENLDPTRKVERSMTEFLHHKMSIWDFGGQNRYTKKYLEKPEMYFKQISQVFYIVDCQNTAWIQKSIEYFHQLIHQISQFSPSAQISIIYNKMDPEFLDQELLARNQALFKTEAIKTLNASTYGYQGYQTSKHVPLWVMTAFSKSLLDNVQLFDTISNQLREISSLHNLTAAICFTSEGFGLGHYVKKDFKDIQIRKLFITFFTKFEQMYNIMPIIDLNFQGTSIYSTRFYLDAEHKTFPIFLGLLYEDEAPIKESIEFFIDSLRNQINTLI